MAYRKVPSSETKTPKHSRRRRAAFLAAALILPSAIGVGAVIDGGMTPSAMAAAARNAAAILAQRTPGLRSGALMQTKNKPVPPAHAALEKSEPPAEPPAYPPAFGLVEKTDMPPETGDIEFNPPAGAVGENPGPFGDNTVITPLSEGLPKGGPEGGGPPNLTTTPTCTGCGGGGGGGGEIPAVPEPSTWAIMIIGFFSVGFALRAQRRRAADAAGVRA